MKITGSSHISTDPQRAYTILQDPEVLARCMPGCQSLTRTGPDEYDMKLKMLIASIQGLFAGKIRLSDQNAPESFRLVVEGSGKVGFMKGDGLIKLSPNAEGTAVAYEGDVQVGGMIAGVGQRLVETTAKMLIRKFFDKLGACAADSGRDFSPATPAEAEARPCPGTEVPPTRADSPTSQTESVASPPETD